MSASRRWEAQVVHPRRGTLPGNEKEGGADRQATARVNLASIMRVTSQMPGTVSVTPLTHSAPAGSSPAHSPLGRRPGRSLRLRSTGRGPGARCTGHAAGTGRGGQTVRSGGSGGGGSGTRTPRSAPVGEQRPRARPSGRQAVSRLTAAPSRGAAGCVWGGSQLRPPRGGPGRPCFTLSALRPPPRSPGSLLRPAAGAPQWALTARPSQQPTCHIPPEHPCSWRTRGEARASHLHGPNGDHTHAEQ